MLTRCINQLGSQESKCNTPGATKVKDVTNIPSHMPEYKTRQQNPYTTYNMEATTRTKL
jgi:hypothetical protein